MKAGFEQLLKKFMQFGFIDFEKAFAWLPKANSKFLQPEPTVCKNDMHCFVETYCGEDNKIWQWKVLQL